MISKSALFITLLVCTFKLNAQLKNVPACDENPNAKICLPISPETIEPYYEMQKIIRGKKKFDSNTFIFQDMQRNYQKQLQLNNTTMKNSQAAAIESATQVNQAQSSAIKSVEIQRQKEISAENFRKKQQRQQLKVVAPTTSGRQFESDDFHSNLAKRLGKSENKNKNTLPIKPK